MLVKQRSGGFEQGLVVRSLLAALPIVVAERTVSAALRTADKRTVIEEKGLPYQRAVQLAPAVQAKRLAAHQGTIGQRYLPLLRWLPGEVVHVEQHPPLGLSHS